MSGRSFRRQLLALPFLALGLVAGTTVYAEAPAKAPVAATAQPADAVTGKTPWGFSVYDIPVDPAVRYGVLPNGLKYAILKNDTPQDTASIRMRYNFGSLAESDSEQGLAHFIEHMAFNGSKNVPEGEMVKLLERDGLAFGADTNASTGFDNTTYKLDLPRTDMSLLDTGLMLMRETASNLTIAPDAVDRERGVVLSEMRTRNSFQLRQIKALFQFEAPNSLIGNRLPIGTQEVLENATAAQLRSLYERYYRPDNATLVIVGNLDPDAVESEIRRYFADWQPVGPAGTPIDYGTVDPKRPTGADIFVDPATPYSATLVESSPYAFRPTTVDELRQYVLERIATGIVTRRIQRIAQQPDAPILAGVASINQLFQTANQAQISITGKEGKWEDALRIGEQELRRANQYGFTQAELAEQLANIENDFQQSAAQQATRRNSQLAEQIAGTAADGDIFVLPSTQLAAFEKIKPTLTVDAVNAAFRAQFATANPQIFVTGKEPIEGGSDAVLAAYRAAAATPVAAPENKAAETFGYGDFGTPGKIVSDTTIPDLGIRTIRFANNVMLNLKQTDFEQGKLRFQIDLGRGLLALPKDEPGLPIYLSSLLAQGGLGKHSFDDLQTLMAGKQVALGLAASDDNFVVGGSTKMADFATQMAVSAAYVTDPGYRPEMQARWQALVPLFVAQLSSTPQQVAAVNVERILANDDPRFGIPDGETLLQRNTGELKAALAPTLADAPIEISVVGDFDPDAVIADVAKTFGALPTRRASFAPVHSFPGITFPTDTSPVTLYHKGKPDQGLAIVAWPTTDDSNAQDETTMSLLAQVLQLDLLEVIREQLGATYSPNASSSMSDVFAGYGTMQVQVVVAPEDRQKVFDAIDAIAKDLRDNPPSADLLERARNPMLERIAKNQHENGYWLGVASHAQSEADRLDRARTKADRVKAVTPEMIQAAAAKYLLASREKKIAIIPDPSIK
jgi:zinc protease